MAILDYVGSITIDEDLVRAAGLAQGGVLVVDITHGAHRDPRDHPPGRYWAHLHQR
ncbi:hypothetical protein CZ774_17110 [Frigoribacterium sp. JB110]|nr:hypothetical protein CZ774_17110 [Frigoribacterium sp. JB110]